MSMFDDNIRDQLKGILGGMKNNVRLVYFTQELECPMCRETRSFVEEFAGLSDKIELQVYNFVTDGEVAAGYGIDKIPAITLLDSEGSDHGIKFYGLPGGYEINSFLGALLEVSGVKQELPDDILSRIKAIDRDVHIQVFVGLACPYCPGAVSTAHRIALENSHVKADMVDVNNFAHLANRYNVSGVPKVVINEKSELTGAYPINTFLDTIEKL